MSLLDLIRGRQKSASGKVATVTPATSAAARRDTDPSAATVAPVTVANPGEPESACAVWDLHFSDLDPLTVLFSPTVTLTQVLDAYRAAVAAVPVAEPVPVPLSPDLLAQVEACLRAGVLVEDDRPALGRGFAVDPVGTRELIEAMHAHVPTCRHCLHHVRPGLSGGYCTKRYDLPMLYGMLHGLPANQGADCPVFALAR